MTKHRYSGFQAIPTTILLVDDRYTAIAALRAYLQPEGYRLVAATSGGAALDAVRSVRIDLVVLDVVMPEMDGIEVAERLRLNPATRGLPIVFLTALPDQVRDRYSGVLDPNVVILGKPAPPELLRVTIRQLLYRASAETPSG